MYEITRKLEIDCGHRVLTHGSKCRNLHGHRYVVVVTLLGIALRGGGTQAGMILDFGFLKEEMAKILDAFDHTMILWLEDPWLFNFLEAGVVDEASKTVREHRWCGMQDSKMGAVTVVDKIPTAENLADLWFTLLEPRIDERSHGQATLKRVKVWETPNCTATYEPARP